MPQPTPAQVHIDSGLTNISIAYMQDHAGFLADKLFPILPVEHKSDLFFKYTKGFWFRDTATKRAPGTESAGTGYGVSTGSYNCEPYALHADVDPQTRANQDSPLDADIDATQLVTEQMLISRERQFLAKYFTTGVWLGSSTGGDITPGTLWSAANSTPIEDINKEIWAVQSITGKFPNRLSLGSKTWQALQNHAEILDRIKYTQKAVLTTDLLASLIAPPGGPVGDDFKVVVASAIINSAAEGAADSYSYMASPKDALLCYAEPNPGLRKASAGYIFTWRGMFGGDAYGTFVAKFPMPHLGISPVAGVTERVEVQMAFDPNLVAADLGAYFHGAVA